MNNQAALWWYLASHKGMLPEDIACDSGATTAAVKMALYRIAEGVDPTPVPFPASLVAGS